MKTNSPCGNAFVLLLVAVSAPLANGASVQLLRTPDSGIQPQAVVDDTATAHLIYFKGDPKSGELFYTRIIDGEKFGQAIPVNDSAKGAMAIGNIRGAQLAAGKNGRIHVVWMGGGKAMYYARLNAAATAFEAPRNLVTWAGGLDGGGTVAADNNGNVYVAWNGNPPGNKNGEPGRAVFLARSIDDGTTFSREERVTSTEAGVCACCGMRAHADARSNLYLLYRAADGKNRDMTLLASSDAGKTFRNNTINRWPVNICPMSSSTITKSSNGLIVATERNGQVSFTRLAPDSPEPSETTTAPGVGKRKHPLILTNAKGEMLFAWTENMGWAKGGSLAWQLYDGAHKPQEKGSASGVPVWSLITGFAKPNGDFILIY